jgi:hypothetical protein
MDFDTDTLITLSFAAYRVNNGYVKQTNRFSDTKTVYNNKELIVYTVSDNWKPEGFVPLTVTEEDVAARAVADKHMRRYTLLALGNLSTFDNDIFSAYSSERLPIGRIGLIAYLPEFVNRELKEKTYTMRIKTEFAESKHFTSKEIKGNIEILKVIRVAKEFEEPFYMHFGAINGNLVCFARKEGFAEGKVYVISAKVKGNEKERESGLPMTRINYVKLRKTEV